VITVEGICPIEETVRIMIEHKIGCLPVMDGEKLIGIITETDILDVRPSTRYQPRLFG
jgi:acetoin utilization protein AcuB